MPRTSEGFYGELNFFLFFSMLKALADGRHQILEEFGFDLATVNELGELKAKDLVLLARAPGYFIDRHTKDADNTAFENMIAHARSSAEARDAIDELILRGAPASMVKAIAGLDHQDHAWKRKLLRVPERQAGRPNNVDDETRQRVEAAMIETRNFDGPLPARLMAVCEKSGASAEQVWTALRQIRELSIPDHLDQPLLDLLSSPEEKDR